MKFLRQHAYTLIFIACIAVAYTWPQYFISVRGWKLTGLVMPLVEVIMFGMGMTLRASDFLNVLKRPAPVALGAALQFAFMPLTGLCVALLLGLDGEIATGVVLIGSVAGGVASNVIAYIAGANVALSVTMTAVSTCLAPLMTPVLMRLFAGRFVQVDAVAMALSLIEMVILPIAASQMVRWALGRKCPGALQTVNRLMPYLSMTALCAMTFISVAPAQRHLREAGVLLLLAAVVHNGIGYLSGYWGARLLGRFFNVELQGSKKMNINNLEKFKAKIAAGKFCLGASIALTDPSVTEMAADCGFDFVFIDGEHGDIDRKTAMDHLMAIRGTDCASLYRVPCASHTEIKKIIDFAPAGIVVPMVMNAEEAEMVVKAMRYPPFGTRGCGFRRGTGYGTGDFDAYWRASEDDPMTIVQLEHIEAYRDLDRILAVKGLDSILIGPYDLSASMGKAGKWDDPDVRQVFDDACRRILKAGLLLGVSLDDRAEEWRARGVNYMQVMSDLTALRHSWQYMIKSLT